MTRIVTDDEFSDPGEASALRKRSGAHHQKRTAFDEPRDWGAGIPNKIGWRQKPGNGVFELRSRILL